MSGNVEIGQAIPRDYLKRPLVLPPVPDEKDPSKRRPYQRVTTFAGIIDETFNLEQHGKRQVAWGMGHRKDLQLLAASIENPDHDAAKKQLDEIHTQAKSFAQDTFKSNVGTALHQFCETLDRGQTPRNVPPNIAADLAAYRATMAHFTIHEIESFRVFDDWQLAGTADRVVEIDGRYYIADIKSGRIDFPRKMALQLAVYAHAKRYDVTLDQRVEVPYQVDLDKAIIIHLPPERGECTLHWLDIRKGWAGCSLAYQVREFRKESKEKHLLWDYVHDTDAIVKIDNPKVSNYLAAVAEAGTVDDVVAIWRFARAEGCDTPEFLAACAARKQRLIAVA